MPSLRKADDRFGITFSILEGGTGTFTGIISEPEQGEVPSYQFNMPRRLLRVAHTVPVRIGMVIRSPAGGTFMVARHGDSEGRNGIHFKSFRLFEAEGQFTWQRRGKATDPVTKLDTDTGLQDLPSIWGVYEPSPEMFDRQLRTSFEGGRFITNQIVKRDDIVDGRRVSRADEQLGLHILALG